MEWSDVLGFFGRCATLARTHEDGFVAIFSDGSGRPVQGIVGCRKGDDVVLVADVAPCATLAPCQLEAARRASSGTLRVMGGMAALRARLEGTTLTPVTLAKITAGLIRSAGELRASWVRERACFAGYAD